MTDITLQPASAAATPGEVATATAHIPTASGSRYLQQLCKHFAHKIPVEFTPEAGSIAFGFGTCRLAATATGLDLALESPDPSALVRLQDVVVRHLVRFAFREELAVAWQRPA